MIIVVKLFSYHQNFGDYLILLWYGQICVSAAVAMLEECCMAFADMQVAVFIR